MIARNQDRFQAQTTRFLSIKYSGIVLSKIDLKHHLQQFFGVENINYKIIGILQNDSQSAVIELNTRVPIPFESFFIESKGKRVIISNFLKENSMKMKLEKNKKVYFRGMNPKTRLKSIKRLFQAYGKVNFCKILEIPNSNNTRSGFVLFDERWSIDMINMKRNCLLDGYRLFISEYSTRKPKLLSKRNDFNNNENSKSTRSLSQMKMLLGQTSQSDPNSKMIGIPSQMGAPKVQNNPTPGNLKEIKKRPPFNQFSEKGQTENLNSMVNKTKITELCQSTHLVYLNHRPSNIRFNKDLNLFPQYPSDLSYKHQSV